MIIASTSYPGTVTLATADAALIRARRATLDAKSVERMVRAQAIQGLARTGLSIRQIAFELHLSKSVVARAARDSAVVWPLPEGSPIPVLIEAAWAQS